MDDVMRHYGPKPNPSYEQFAVDVMASYGCLATVEEAGFVLWNCTGFPAFYPAELSRDLSHMAIIENQVRSYCEGGPS